MPPNLHSAMCRNEQNINPKYTCYGQLCLLVPPQGTTKGTDSADDFRAKTVECLSLGMADGAAFHFCAFLSYLLHKNVTVGLESIKGTRATHSGLASIMFALDGPAAPGADAPLGDF